MPNVDDRARSSRPVPQFRLALCALLAPASLAAQNYRLDLPWPSPHATVSTVVGMTTFSVDYHRPGVNGRVIWGGLVPFDTVWRAGANENTLLVVTSPFMVGGTTLPAGRYGVFMIPTRTAWTVALSKQSNAWGAFSYDPREDAVRFVVTPKPAEYTERLQYSFDDPTATTVSLTMTWEKLAVSFPISVNTSAVVLDSLKSQLRNLPRFWAPAWQQAAGWALANTTNLDLPNVWADSAILLAPTFASYSVKALVLDRQGKHAEADSLRQAHLASANEAELNAYGYLLVSQKKNTEALAIFLRNTKEHPDSWNTWDSLGEMYATLGDRKKAVANYTKALGMTSDPVQQQRIRGILAGLK
jgi:hypothetical protein